MLRMVPLPRFAGQEKIVGAVALVALLLGGCDLTMFRQPKYKTQAPAPLFSDNTESQTPPAGAVAQGALADEQASTRPPPATPQLLARGKARFEIYCKPCHGVSGEGDGIVVARGFPHPPAYSSARVRGLTGAQIFGVITNGYGVMFPYGDRVDPQDRWAIVAYIRALELAHDMGEAPVPPPAGSSGGRR